MMRKLLATIAALLLFGSFTPTSASADSWVPPSDFDANSIGFNLVESFYNTGEQQSKLISVSQESDGKFQEHLCTGANSSEFCKSNISGQILLPYCDRPAQSNCVESLSIAGSPSEQLVPASFIRQATGPKVTADPGRGLTEGSTVSLWSSDIKNTKGTGDYAIYAALSVGFNSSAGTFTYGNLTSMVVPYAMQPGSYQQPSATEFVASDGTSHVSNSGGRVECVFTEVGQCGRIQDFSDGTKVSMTLRLVATIGGWFKGRVVDPTIEVSPGSGSENGAAWQRITMTGEPAKVPLFYAKGPKSSASQAMLDFMGRYWAGGVNNARSDGPLAFQALELFKNLTGDSASGVSTIWSMGSLAPGANPCLANTSKVLGIVSTNAMVYEPNAPEFVAGALKYKVGGTHFLPDKSSLSEGTYDLIIDSKAARCLYGFTSAPISAEISVVTSDGQTKVATTTFKETGSWVKLSARGFTFSQPTVSVRLIQSVPPKVKASTVICVSLKNKKITKTIKGVNPRCPSGFKKK